MNMKDFIRLGIPLGEATRRAADFISKFILAGGNKTRLEEEVKAIIANPSSLTEDSLRGELAEGFIKGSGDLANYRPLGIFIGWEVPGVFDAVLQIRNLSLKAGAP
jgi:hypothetical protein